MTAQGAAPQRVTLEQVAFPTGGPGSPARHYVPVGRGRTLCGRPVVAERVALDGPLCKSCARLSAVLLRPRSPDPERFYVPVVLDAPPATRDVARCPDCGARKSRVSARCFRCYHSAVVAAWTPPPRMLCPVCGERKSQPARVCWDCHLAGR